MDNNQNNQNNYYNDPYNTNTSAGQSYYQTSNQAYTPVQTYTSPEQPQKKNIATLVLSIVSLVCGILSLELCIFYGLGIFFAIPGLITRNIALKKNNGVGGNMARAGFITSLIGLIISGIIFLVFILALIAGVAEGITAGYSSDYYY